MKIHFPAKERATANAGAASDDLANALKHIAALRTDFVKMQKYEDAARLRDMEKQVEQSLSYFKELQKDLKIQD